MFENFENAKQKKRKTWATILLSVSVVFHAVVFVALMIRSFWVINKLEAPKRETMVAVAPPPPPPPPKGGQKMKDQPKDIKPKKRKVTEMVQPVKIEPKVEDTSSAPLENEGVEGGQEGG